MVKFASGLNPKILKWARERAGYTLEDISGKLKKDIKLLENWESGSKTPTYSQLEKLAYSYYKLPIAIFYFPEPPAEKDLKKEFRTLPDYEIDNLKPDTRFALRQAQAMQMDLEELNDGINRANYKIFREIKINLSINITNFSAEVRDYLGVSLDKQISWKDNDNALKKWRTIIEEKGIFVFKRSFKQEEISGFSLIDKEFPVIYLNNSTTKTRQIFTLFHELAHILLHTNGITKKDDSYINVLKGEEKEIEVFCNRFAAEFLVPSGDFEKNLSQNAWDDESIGKLAKRYFVSREVICRKLLERKLVSQEYYEKKKGEWADDYKKNKENRSGGGNYYDTQTTYLGEKFLRLAFGRYYESKCTIEELADYLNVKVKSVSGLEEKLMQFKD